MQYPKLFGKSLYFLIAVALVVVIVAGSAYALTQSAPQVVASGDTVKVYYTGTFSNGTVFDSNVGTNHTLNFTVGAGRVIKGFDVGVIGMKLNETRKLTIPPSEAYGEVNSSLIVQVPLSAFGNHTIYPGNIIAETLPNGGTSEGLVQAVNSTTATINFNPRLAGDTLIFTVRVVGIKKG